MKTKFLLPIIPLAIGAAFFGIRRSEHLALQKTLSELEQAKPSSRADSEGLQQSGRSTRPAVDLNFFRDAVSDMFAAEQSPETRTEEEEKEFLEQLARLREQLTHASAAEVLALIPEGFSFKEHSFETELGVFVALILSNLENVNLYSYLEIMGSTDLEPLAFSGKADSLNHTLIKWAHKSPEEAYAWYQNALSEKNPIVESEEFEAARLKFLAPIAPEEVITEILALDLQEEHHVYHFSQMFSADDPELEDISKVISALNRQLASHPESERLEGLRRHYISDIAPDLAGRGYQEAHAYMEQHFSATDKANFFEKMSRNSLQANEAWLDFGMLHASPSGIGSLVRHWAVKDPTTSGQWLSKQEDGPKKEEAVYMYAEAVTKVDPAAAREWAETLSDSKKKKRLLKKIAAQK